MSLSTALGSPVISAIRAQVPEFEDTFLVLVEDEGQDLGCFQAMSEFASWLRARMSVSPHAPEVQRAFGLVEALAVKGDLALARPLVTEFVEALVGDPGAVARMGPETRRRYNI